MVIFTNFNDYNFQNLKNNVISYLISELFSNIDSKELFNQISNLLISSLNKFKKHFPYEHTAEINLNNPELIEDNENLKSKIKDINYKNEYLDISNDIQAILSNCSDLTHNQKLDFCNNQRHFMKLYLKEVILEMSKS